MMFINAWMRDFHTNAKRFAFTVELKGEIHAPSLTCVKPSENHEKTKTFKPMKGEPHRESQYTTGRTFKAFHKNQDGLRKPTNYHAYNELN